MNCVNAFVVAVVTNGCPQRFDHALRALVAANVLGLIGGLLVGYSAWGIGFASCVLLNTAGVAGPTRVLKSQAPRKVMWLAAPVLRFVGLFA